MKYRIRDFCELEWCWLLGVWLYQIEAILLVNLMHLMDMLDSSYLKREIAMKELSMSFFVLSVSFMWSFCPVSFMWSFCPVSFMWSFCPVSFMWSFCPVSCLCPDRVSPTIWIGRGINGEYQLHVADIIDINMLFKHHNQSPSIQLHTQHSSGKGQLTNGRLPLERVN
jgi:hypothetical protein